MNLYMNSVRYSIEEDQTTRGERALAFLQAVFFLRSTLRALIYLPTSKAKHGHFDNKNHPFVIPVRTINTSPFFDEF